MSAACWSWCASIVSAVGSSAGDQSSHARCTRLETIPRPLRRHPEIRRLRSRQVRRARHAARGGRRAALAGRVRSHRLRLPRPGDSRQQAVLRGVRRRSRRIEGYRLAAREQLGSESPRRTSAPSRRRAERSPAPPAPTRTRVADRVHRASHARARVHHPRAQPGEARMAAPARCGRFRTICAARRS